MALRRTTHVRAIRHTGPRVRTVDPSEVAKALAAQVSSTPPATRGAAGPVYPPRSSPKAE
jgi:hypothetical protein